jgi:hypothetical protein
MPWTEDPNDTTANQLRAQQEQLATTLQSSLKLQLAAGGQGDQPRSLYDLVGNSLTNADAMTVLRSGFKGQPQRSYLAVADAPIVNDKFSDLTIHVLGPSRDESVITHMDPPATESYVAGQSATEPGDQLVPFQRRFAIREDDLLANTPWEQLKVPDDIRQSAQAFLQSGDAWNAVALDQAINGTSLVLVFQYGSATLLFPGDAQWGTWNMMLNDANSRALLASATFYKIGHHGSHNATPRTFVEDVIGPALWGAAASVHPVHQWPNIPKPELLDALLQHTTRVVTSDAPGVSNDGVQVHDNSVDFLVPC